MQQPPQGGQVQDPGNRDLRQVKALYWRMWKHARKDKCRSFWAAFGSVVTTYVILQIALNIYHPQNLQLVATENAFVTSSTPNYQENVFVKPQTEGGFENALYLRNCTLQGRFEIGLIKQDSSGGTEGYSVLEAVFNELAEAYETSYAGTSHSYKMSKKDFETNDDIDKYVSSFSYADHALCFAIGWQEFDPSQHKYAVNLRWNFGTVLSTRLPQIEYEESSYNQLYLPQYANTGFLQAMTSVTNKILSEVYGSNDHTIQMLYMPMNSKEFENDMFSEVVGALIPLMVFVLINYPDKLKMATSDIDEDKVQRLLQRLGMRKSVDLYVEDIAIVCALPLLVFTCLIAIFQVTKTTSFWFMFWNVVIYACNVSIMNHLIKFAIDDHFWAEFTEQLLEILGITLVIWSYLLPVIDPLFVNISSFLLPLPAFNWIIKLGIIASNKGITVEMLQPNVIVNHNDMTYVMRLALLQMSIKLAFQIWCWPFKVYNNERGSRGPLYCLNPSFWREISCCGRRQSVESEDEASLLPDVTEDFSQDTNEELLSASQRAHQADKQLLPEEREMIKKGFYESLDGKEGYRSKNFKTLQLKNVDVKHGKHPLVDDLSLTIFENEVFILIGENGSGKSNVLSTMAGFQHVHSGSCTAFDVNLFKDLRFLRKTLLAYSEQDVTLLGTLTPAENIEFVCRFLGLPNIDELVKKTLIDFELLDTANISARILSPVVRKKLSLALTLISGAKVILLDTPTDGMNIAEKRTMWQQIRARRQGRVIVVATQDIEEAEQLGDRICLLTHHAKIEFCGTPKFFAEKLNFSLQVVFILSRMQDEVEDQKRKEELKQKVEEALEPENRQKVSIMWNHLDQLAIKLPREIQHKTVNKCIDFESLHEFKGHLYEDYQVKRDTLAMAFQRNKLRNSENGNIEQQENAQLESRARKISWCRSTLYLIQSDFCRKSFWFQMLKVFIICLIVIGQETIFLIFFLDSQDLPVINLTNIEETWEEHHPPIHIFANTELPGSSTSTAPLLDAYTACMNEEVTQVKLKAVALTSAPESTVLSYMASAATTIEELAEEAEEEHIEYFAGFEIYQMDDDTKTYSIGVYGNQVAAASTTSFGATMLQTLAQKISGQPKLQLEIHNHMLPINADLMPMQYPAIAEAFGVTTLAACIVLIVFQMKWHGKPIQTGFFHAFLVKGGTQSGYQVAKYLKLVLSNFILIAAICLLMYSQKLDLGGAVPICIVWCFISPLMVHAYNNSYILQLYGSYEESVRRIRNVGASLLALATITAGVIAYSQQQEDAFYLFTCFSCSFTPLLLFQSIVFGLLYELDQTLKMQDENEVIKGPYQNPDSFVYFYLGLMISVILTWGIIFLISLNVRHSIRSKCCCKIKGLQEQEDADWQVMVQQQLNLDQSASENELDAFLKVEKLQNMRVFYANLTDTKNIRVNLEKAQLVYVNSYMFGLRTTRGVSFTVKKRERFAILGDRLAATYLFRAIMGFQRQIAGSYTVDQTKNGAYKHMHGLVGYQPHTNSIDEELTVRQHLNLFVKLVGVPKQEREMTVRAIIDDCLLNGLEDTESGGMSYGLLRRLTLAMALIGKPKFVILDNPLESIDPTSKHKLIGTIKKYTTDSTVLLATQDCEEAELICDRIAIMHQGKFMAIGKPSQIIEQHGEGYQVDVHADLEKIFKQAPKFSAHDDLLIYDIFQAIQVLQKMQKTLKEKRVEASFDFCAEFHKEGQLSNLFETFMSNLPYPVHKFHTQVLVQNLALQLVEEIFEQFPSQEVSISEITAGFIRLQVVTQGHFDFTEFSNEVDLLSHGLAISDISVRAATLATVYERVIHNATFNMEQIRLMIQTKVNRKRNVQTKIQTESVDASIYSEGR